jgi:branched-chain amino acid transport system ATP-binding protein
MMDPVKSDADASTPFLRVEDLKKQFGNLSVLEGISFSVQSGEILGIAGPNGAGKTTLFNLISGLLSPTSGEVYFEDHRITYLKPYQICPLGITRTFQIPVVFPTLTVWQNVSVGALFGNRKSNRKNLDASINGILRLLEIDDLKSSSAHQLSLYHRKLVMLAATLATQPRLLLLDEPLAGLTHGEIEHFMKILNQLNRNQRMTIVIIEHLIDWLRILSKRMLVIHNGVVMASGSPEQVIKDASVIEIYLGKEQDAPRS